MPVKSGPPPSDDHLRRLTAATGGHHSPALDATEWILIVFAHRDNRVVGCGHYTDIDALFTALDAVGDHEYAQVHVPGPIAPTEYLAAARHVQPAAGGTVHVRDDDTDPGTGHDGYTVCGLPLTYTERWLDVPAPMGGVCTACDDGEFTDVEMQPWQG